eukprot:Pompholyxophrys_punicea_v1_NODE_7_length_8407_cov_7.217433.p4 type:complete len:104 gc:universal NODE_7_length_8407_cov_7.217433:4704-4393(-)
MWFTMSLFPDALISVNWLCKFPKSPESNLMLSAWIVSFFELSHLSFKLSSFNCRKSAISGGIERLVLLKRFIAACCTTNAAGLLCPVNSVIFLKFASEISPRK